MVRWRRPKERSGSFAYSYDRLNGNFWNEIVGVVHRGARVFPEATVLNSRMRIFIVNMVSYKKYNVLLIVNKWFGLERSAKFMSENTGHQFKS